MPSLHSSSSHEANISDHEHGAAILRCRSRPNVHFAASAETDCVICNQLVDADGRYFGRLLRDVRARTTLSQSIATSMGFCADHTASIASSDTRTTQELERITHDAARHLQSMLERTVLQDELIQDILFGARARCPACAYFHRSEGRAVARVLHGLEDTKRPTLPPLCFVHAQLLIQRAEPPLRGRLRRLLRVKADAAVAALCTPIGNEVDDTAITARQILYPHAQQEEPRADPHCTCLGCEAIAMARRQWLVTAANNVRLQQPGWIALPTCRKHLFQCLEQSDTSLRRAALQRYLEVALPARRSSTSSPVDPPKRRRRNKVRWFNAAGAAQASGNAPVPEAMMHDPCPGCDAEEIAGRRSIALLIRRVSRTNDDEAAAMVTAGVCLKHFAEALIYASDPKTESRLKSALSTALRGGATCNRPVEIQSGMENQRTAPHFRNHTLLEPGAQRTAS